MPDPGIGVGAGGAIASLLNPGLASSVAQSITPNPNPLAQQGQPGQPGTVDSLGNPIPKPNLAQPAVTQPDPANAANVAKLADPTYAENMMRYQRMNQLSADLNHSIQGVAAGFGTAQQQAAKQNALRAGDGTVGGGLADLMNIQKMQEATIGDNERARFMGNAQVFADSLSRALGRPVTIQEAQMYQQNPDLLQGIASTMTGNQKSTDTQKNVDADMQAWAAANPNATQQEIAQHKSDLMEQSVGGLSGVGKNLAEDRRNWQHAHPGGSFAQMVADKPELADETSYVAIKGEQAKQHAIAGQEKQGAIDTFPSLDVSYQTAESKIEWLQAHPEALAKAIRWGDAARGRVGQVAGAFGALDKDTADARGILDQLNDINFRGGMTNVKNVRSQIEAMKIGGSVTNLDKVNNSDQQIQSESQRLFDIAHTARGNLLGAAGKVIPARYTGLVDPSYLDPNSSVYNGATLEKVDFSKMSKDDAERAYETLPPGTVFTGPDGNQMRKPW